MKKEFLYFTLFFIISIILIQTIILINLSTIPENTQLIKAEATGGSFSLCLNFPPKINLSNCPTQINQSTSRENNTLNCEVITSHPKNHTVTIDRQVINRNGFHYDIKTNGELTLQAFQQELGTHELIITAQDNHTECPFTTQESYDVEILDINDPPHLVASLPNVELNAGTESAPFALNEYFDDIDTQSQWGKPLSYDYYSSGDLHVEIEITSNSLVVIQSSEDNCEEDYVYFEATDRGGLSTDSNLIKINSMCLDPDSSSPGGSSGGPTCEPKWECEDWSECYINGTQKKLCEDKYRCEDPKTFWRDCEYTASCSDDIKNCHLLPDGSILCEEGVDCGGPCEPCTDDNEEEPEEKEATCSDNIKNCHILEDGSTLCEEGVDCGGPCEPCRRVETPQVMVDEEANNTILYLAISIVLIAGLIATYIIFRKQILTFFAKISWWLTRKKRKQFLLKDEEKLKFLTQIKLLYNKINNSQTQTYARKDKELINIIKLSRDYLATSLKLSSEFDYETIKKNINQTIINKSLEQGLILYAESFFEKERKNTNLTKQELLNFVQETRMLVMNTSKLKKEDFNFKALETNPQNTNISHALSLIHNAYLALCFSEAVSAQKNYVELLHLYEKLTDNEKNKLYPEISKIYYYTKTIMSWV